LLRSHREGIFRYSGTLPAHRRVRIPKTTIASSSRIRIYYCRGVAQPGSAPALGAGGPRFESGRPDHSIRQNLADGITLPARNVLSGDKVPLPYSGSGQRHAGSLQHQCDSGHVIRPVAFRALILVRRDSRNQRRKSSLSSRYALCLALVAATF
jgi:hypothetical protein